MICVHASTVLTVCGKQTGGRGTERSLGGASPPIVAFRSFEATLPIAAVVGFQSKFDMWNRHVQCKRHRHHAAAAMLRHVAARQRVASWLYILRASYKFSIRGDHEVQELNWPGALVTRASLPLSAHWIAPGTIPKAFDNTDAALTQSKLAISSCRG